MPSRIRQRGVFTPHSGVDHLYPVGSSVSSDDLDFSGDESLDSYEEIQDDNHGKYYGHSWGDLVHLKISTISTGMFHNYLDDSYVKTFSGDAYVPRAMASTGPRDYYPATLLARVEQASDQLLIEATEQIHESFNIVNDLLELDDLKEIIPKFEAVVQFLRDCLLSYEFGIKPTLSDLKKLCSFIPETLARIKWLKKWNGKSVRVRKSGLVTDVPPGVSFPSGYERGSLQVEARPYSLSCHFTLNVIVKINLDGLDSLESMLESFATALGITNLVSTVWNAIPYSFILEWFVNLNPFLNAFHESPYKGTMEVVDSWTTSKVSVLWDLFQKWDFRSDGGSEFAQIGTTFLTSTFRRTKGLPMSGSPWSGSLSTLQQVLLAALGHQRLSSL